MRYCDHLQKKNQMTFEFKSVNPNRKKQKDFIIFFKQTNELQVLYNSSLWMLHTAAFEFELWNTVNNTNFETPSANFRVKCKDYKNEM